MRAPRQAALARQHEDDRALEAAGQRSQRNLIADRTRSAIAEQAFDVGGERTVHRACSVGVAAYPLSLEDVHALTWERVVAVTDWAQYLAKRSGTNAWGQRVSRRRRVGRAAASRARGEPRAMDGRRYGHR